MQVRVFTSLLILLVCGVVSFAQTKKASTERPPPPFVQARQAIIVTTDAWEATRGTALIFERKTSTGDWVQVRAPFPVVVGRNGLAGTESLPRWSNRAPTLTPVFERYCEAMRRRDNRALGRIYSADTLKYIHDEMATERIKSLTEYLEDEQIGSTKCFARNEFIDGDRAQAVIHASPYPKGMEAEFLKENGEWKMTNRSPTIREFKNEGDGRSPAGLFPLTFAFGTTENPATDELPFVKLEEFTECVDDERSTFYNRVVDRMKIGNFDWKSSEKMAEVVPEYDLGVFVGYNSYPVKSGAGSCIFLHIWKNADSPTAGCTAMAREDLERVVAWLSKSKNPYLVQMPKETYEARQKLWKLPKLK